MATNIKLLGVDSHFFSYDFKANTSEMTIDIGKTGMCIVMVQNSSTRALGSLFLVSWNANSYLIITPEDTTKNISPRRPSNGSSSIVLSDLIINNQYSVKCIFLNV